jgi:hypothetical protein
MTTLGFSKPVTTGPKSALYDHEGAAMSVISSPEEVSSRYHFFDFGGSNVGELRRILGLIADKTSFEVQIGEWKPPLPEPTVP